MKSLTTTLLLVAGCLCLLAAPGHAKKSAADGEVTTQADCSADCSGTTIRCCDGTASCSAVDDDKLVCDGETLYCSEVNAYNSCSLQCSFDHITCIEECEPLFPLSCTDTCKSQRFSCLEACGDDPSATCH